MNASYLEKATEIDYFITNVEPSKITPEWIVNSYSNRNWVEVFYREAKGWLGLKEYQVRDKWRQDSHFILVFCAYTFIPHSALQAYYKYILNEEVPLQTLLLLITINSFYNMYFYLQNL